VALRRRARQLRHARPSITRLRARIRGAAPSADLSGVSLGISVDPPEMEEGVAGQGPQEH
jgi:hypothetical protein